jgi:hypothetical protein
MVVQMGLLFQRQNDPEVHSKYPFVLMLVLFHLG